jgi:hypothetical protein
MRTRFDKYAVGSASADGGPGGKKRGKIFQAKRAYLKTTVKIIKTEKRAFKNRRFFK